jgi:hypothetical protein
VAIAYQPYGLRQNRQLFAAAGNFQANIRTIKKGYASAIGFGDPVITLTGANAGYIGPYAEGGTRVLGVLIGLLPYFDTTLQALVNKNWWAGTENASGDVSAFVIDDISQSFLIQVNGGPITQAHVGLNADIGGAGAPATSGGSTGASTAYLDFTTVGTASTLPLRIIGISSIAFGGTDPTVPTSQLQANNWAEVRLNTSEFLQQAGV